MSHIELIPMSERNHDMAQTFQEMQDYYTKLICAAYTLTPEELCPDRAVKLRSIVALDRPRPRELVLNFSRRKSATEVLVASVIRALWLKKWAELMRAEFESYSSRTRSVWQHLIWGGGGR